jgi:hypothetical protein
MCRLFVRGEESVKPRTGWERLYLSLSSAGCNSGWNLRAARNIVLFQGFALSRGLPRPRRPFRLGPSITAETVAVSATLDAIGRHFIAWAMKRFRPGEYGRAEGAPKFATIYGPDNKPLRTVTLQPGEAPLIEDVATGGRTES